MLEKITNSNGENDSQRPNMISNDDSFTNIAPATELDSIKAGSTEIKADGSDIEDSNIEVKPTAPKKSKKPANIPERKEYDIDTTINSLIGDLPEGK